MQLSHRDFQGAHSAEDVQLAIDNRLLYQAVVVEEGNVVGLPPSQLWRRNHTSLSTAATQAHHARMRIRTMPEKDVGLAGELPQRESTHVSVCTCTCTKYV